MLETGPANSRKGDLLRDSRLDWHLRRWSETPGKLEAAALMVASNDKWEWTELAAATAAMSLESRCSREKGGVPQMKLELPLDSENQPWK